MTWAKQTTCAGLLALAVLGSAAGAWAEGGDQSDVASTEGVVVALENDDIVVDLAGKRGAATGDVVELWRPLKLQAPGDRAR